MATTSLLDRIEPLLNRVERPSRYIGSEFGSRGADETVDADIAVGLCYPGTYEVGQANQALQILYARLAADPRVAVERVFLPWIDLIELMREAAIELFTLETYRPVHELDILGITMPNEMAATSILEVLDLARIPLHATQRDESHPLVIGGGPCAFNPEPMAPFFDAFFIGEADSAIEEIVSVVREAKASSEVRDEWLDALAHVEGIYVPTLHGCDRDNPIKKRIERDFHTLSLPHRTIVPFVDVIHDRCSIEIVRGCNRGCRFCQAGMTYRPARERDADAIIRGAVEALERTGYEEVSLTSLSSTDHSQIQELVRRLNAQLGQGAINVSLPSLRIDSFSIELMEVLLSGAKRPGLTLAPEAGTQRMRDVINKNVTEEQIKEMVRTAFESGYRRIKLYFMIGLPYETDEDIIGIAKLVEMIAQVARSAVEPRQRGAIKIGVSVSSFVPKPHTPFQWSAQDTTEEIRRKQRLLAQALPHKGVQLSFHDAQTSLLEGLIARGDRTLAPVIEAAWREGARFEAYSEQFDPVHWDRAFEKTAFDPIAHLAPRDFDEKLPWDHISTGVDTAYLIAEATRARDQALTEDCTFDNCTGCGVCGALEVTPHIVESRA